MTYDPTKYGPYREFSFRTGTWVLTYEECVEQLEIARKNKDKDPETFDKILNIFLEQGYEWVAIEIAHSKKCGEI